MTTPSTPQPTQVSEGLRETGEGSFLTPSRLLFLLAGYFALHVLLRVAASTSVDLDESEAVVLSQGLSFGYGPGPPLYIWLQTLLFGVFGRSVFTLSLLKNLLLFFTYALTFVTARALTRSAMAGVAAALSVFFLPSIAWESQRDLTHSVLSATLSVATLLCVINLHETRRLRWYILFGLASGLGCISKYNYALWLLGLLLAGCLLKEIRPALLNLRLLISAALLLVIFLPNGLWMLNHPELALLSSSKLKFQESLSWPQATGLGVKNLAQAVISFTAPLTLIYMLVFLKINSRPRGVVRQKTEYRTLLFTSWALIGALLLLLVLFARATGFKERWFQPILVTLPIAAIALVQNRLDPFRFKCIATLSLLVMLGVATAMPGRLLLAERLKREEPLTRPYAQLARKLRPDMPLNSLLICDTRILAGNLRLGLCDVTALDVELTPLFRGSYAHCFLIWDARRSDLLPEGLRQWAEEHCPSKLAASQAHYVTEVYRYHQTKTFRLGYMQLY